MNIKDVKAKAKARVKAFVKPNRPDIVIGGCTMVLGVLYIHNARKNDRLTHLEGMFKSMCDDIAYMADKVADEMLMREEMRNRVGQLIEAGRDFDYLPSLGIVVKPEGYVPVVKLQHLPSMSKAAQKAVQN